jgi:hypothetical protein
MNDEYSKKSEVIKQMFGKEVYAELMDKANAQTKCLGGRLENHFIQLAYDYVKWNFRLREYVQLLSK